MSRAQPSAPGGGLDDPFAMAVLAAAVAGVAVGGLVWVGAQAAALAANGRTLAVDAADVARALAALPRHASSPALAWPPAAARLLPTAAGYWAAQAGVVVAVGALGVIVGRRWKRSARGHPLRVRADAGLARPNELAALRVRHNVEGRLNLGLVGRSLIAAAPGDSLAVVGPTGCGKTAGFAIPALLEWEGPVIATSVKADLLKATIEHRRREGKVFVYDPTGSAGQGASASWSPLGTCGTWAGAMRTAAWLAEAAQPRRDSVTDGDYWYTQARRGLGPYLYAAGLDGRGMGDVVGWIDSQDIREVRLILDKATYSKNDDIKSGATAAQAVANGLWRREDRLRASVFSTIENILAPYADPGVVAAGKANGFDFTKWLSGNHTLYVVATAHEQARLRPVLSVLVQQAVRSAYDDAARRDGGRLANPLLVMLDEAANIAPLPDLPGYAATARSHGITLVTIWQDLAQLRDLYGHQAQTLLNNHRAKLFGSGIADVDTLDYLSRLIGEQRNTERQRSADVGGGRRTISEHTSYRRLAPPDLLRRVRADRAVLVYGAELPAHVRLRPWYKDPELQRLAKAAAT